MNRSNWVRWVRVGEVPNLEPDADEILEQLGRTVSLHPDPVVLSKMLIKIQKAEAAKKAAEAAKKAAITEENRRLWNEYHKKEASK